LQSLGGKFHQHLLRKSTGELFDTSSQVNPPLAECAWYRDIIFFLQKLQPPDGMEKNKVRALKLRSIKYCLIDQVLYWKYPLGVLLRCLDPQEAQKSCLIFMTVCVGDITSREPQPTRFSELAISGLAYSLMFVLKSRLVSSVINSQENNNSSPCL
jgi:hypothetical protein